MRYLLPMALLLSACPEDSRPKQAEVEASQIADMIENFELKHSRLPDVLEDAVPTASDGRITLKDSDPGHLTLGRRPMDPWNRAYRYEGKGKSFTVRSMGADGADGTADDIIKSVTLQ